MKCLRAAETRRSILVIAASKGGRCESRRSDEAELGRRARRLRSRSDPPRGAGRCASRGSQGRSPARNTAEDDQRSDEDQRRETADPHQASLIAAIVLVRRRVAAVVVGLRCPARVMRAENPRAERPQPGLRRGGGERQQHGLEQQQVDERDRERNTPQRSLRCPHVVHGAHVGGRTVRGQWGAGANKGRTPAKPAG